MSNGYSIQINGFDVVGEAAKLVDALARKIKCDHNEVAKLALSILAAIASEVGDADDAFIAWGEGDEVKNGIENLYDSLRLSIKIAEESKGEAK